MHGYYKFSQFQWKVYMSIMPPKPSYNQFQGQEEILQFLVKSMTLGSNFKVNEQIWNFLKNLREDTPVYIKGFLLPHVFSKLYKSEGMVFGVISFLFGFF